MTTHVRPLTDFLACLLGPAIWAAHFFVIYGAETVVCAGASSPAIAMRWTVGAATAVALAIVAVPFVGSARTRHAGEAEPRRFLNVLSGVLAAFSAAAIIGVAVSALRLPACTLPFG
jgi:hypothetical protein